MISENYELLILHSLNQTDAYAYQLLLRFKEQLEVDIKEVTIYAVIKRLEKKGYLTSYWSQERRKFYKLTDDGRNYYQLIKSQWLIENKKIKVFLEGEI